VVYDPVSGKLKDIVAATIDSLVTTRITRDSMFRLWARGFLRVSRSKVEFLESG
jgi:hypothetical protein